MPPRSFDTLEFSRYWYEQSRPSLAFTAKTRTEATRWQTRLRSEFRRLLGDFPRSPSSLDAEIVERKEFAKYTREKVHFQSRPNLTVVAYFLTPKTLPAHPQPCIICLPGHGRGVDSIIGYNEDGTMREFGQWGEYQKDFALQCVGHGYTTLALEQFGFGYRRDEAARKRGAGASSCQPAAGAALLFGQTMAGWRVYDVMRAIDYLHTRPEVDPKRIAVMGISGGGTISLFSAALDTRIKAAVVSGYFNTFRDSIMSLSHCIDNYVPGILNVAEMYDIAGCIAPRFLFVESATHDNIFPIEATKRAFRETQKIFTALGAADHIAMEEFDADHQFHGTKAFELLKQNL